MMIVISDGAPNEGYRTDRAALDRHLHETIKAITSAGIEVYGVGAGTDDPGKFYKRENGASFQAVKDLSQLATTLVRLLSERLLNGSATA